MLATNLLSLLSDQGEPRESYPTPTTATRSTFARIKRIRSVPAIEGAKGCRRGGNLQVHDTRPAEPKLRELFTAEISLEDCRGGDDLHVLGTPSAETKLPRLFTAETLLEDCRRRDNLHVHDTRSAETSHRNCLLRVPHLITICRRLTFDLILTSASDVKFELVLERTAFSDHASQSDAETVSFRQAHKLFLGISSWIAQSEQTIIGKFVAIQ